MSCSYFKLLAILQRMYCLRQNIIAYHPSRRVEQSSALPRRPVRDGDDDEAVGRRRSTNRVRRRQGDEVTERFCVARADVAVQLYRTTV